jgi:hypothetical protein
MRNRAKMISADLAIEVNRERNNRRGQVPFYRQ